MRRAPRPSLLHVVLLTLLALGAVLRPMLLLSCDIHAVLHAHASNAHDHRGDVDPDNAPGTGHGGHERAALGDAAIPVADYALPAVTLRSAALPPHAGEPVPADLTVPAFRPPIG